MAFSPFIIEYRADKVYIVCPVELSRVSTSIPWHNGFTVTVNAVNVSISSSIQYKNHVELTLSSEITNPATANVNVSYSGTNIVRIDNTSDALAAFMNLTAQWVPLDLMPLGWFGHITAQQPQTIQLYAPRLLAFPQLTHQQFVIKVGQTVLLPSQIASVTYGTVRGHIRISLTAPVSAGMGVTVEPSDTFNGYYVYQTASAVNMPTITIVNGSNYGTISSATGVSSILKMPLQIEQKVVTAEVRVYLNPIDREVVRRFSPTWDPSGAYTPSGQQLPVLVWSDRLQELVDGGAYRHSFTHDNLEYAHAAALLWQQTAVTRISLALNQARDLYISLPTLSASTVFV